MALVLQLCAKLAPPSPAPLFPTPALLFPVSDITGNSLTPKPRSKSSFPDPWAPHRCPPPCLSPLWPSCSCQTAVCFLGASASSAPPANAPSLSLPSPLWKAGHRTSSRDPPRSLLHCSAVLSW